jgi:hypothetical protein
LASISQLLSALDVVQTHHLKPSPAGDPIGGKRRSDGGAREYAFSHNI